MEIDKQYNDVILEDLVVEDRVFGSSIASRKIPLAEDWTLYLRSTEKQNMGGGFDSYSCVSFAAIKAISGVMNCKIEKGLISENDLKWLEDNEYVINGKFDASESFTSVMSGTVPHVGNSGRRVNDSIRNDGLIPQSMRPFTPQTTEDEFFAECTDEQIDMGLEFTKRFNVEYEVVYANDLNERTKALQYSPLNVFIATSCHWKEGIQQGCWNTTNHAVVHYGNNELLADTYYRKQEDGTYKLYRRVAEDFKYYYIGYAYFINTKENKMISTIKISDKVENKRIQGIYLVFPTTNTLREIGGTMDTYKDLLADGVISPYTEVYSLPEGYEVKERITLCK